MLSSKYPLAALLQGILVGYLLVAVLYTTTCFLVSPVSFAVLSLFGIKSSGFVSRSAGPPTVTPRIDLAAHARRVLEARQHVLATPDLGLSSDSSTSWDLESSKDLIYWNGHNSNLPGVSSPDGLNEPLPIREETFLSKAFAQTMHPTDLIPFYYKASGTVDEDDVTITTLVTSNRYKVLKQLVERYQGAQATTFVIPLFYVSYLRSGPISVTIHIPLPPEHSADPTATSQFIAAVKDLEALYTSSPYFAIYVDVHLALSPLSGGSKASSGTPEGGRQFNVWRNVARLFARSEFVMMLDVDFAVCTDWRSHVRTAVRRVGGSISKTDGYDHDEVRSKSTYGGLPPETIQKLRNGTAALVVPAFEYTKQEDGVDQRTFPKDKEVRLFQSRVKHAAYPTIRASYGLLQDDTGS